MAYSIQVCNQRCVLGGKTCGSSGFNNVQALTPEYSPFYPKSYSFPSIIYFYYILLYIIYLYYYIIYFVGYYVI